MAPEQCVCVACKCCYVHLLPLVNSRSCGYYEAILARQLCRWRDAQITGALFFSSALERNRKPVSEPPARIGMGLSCGFPVHTKNATSIPNTTYLPITVQ
jgi:hypothetical protein